MTERRAILAQLDRRVPSVSQALLDQRETGEHKESAEFRVHQEMP